MRNSLHLAIESIVLLVVAAVTSAIKDRGIRDGHSCCQSWAGTRRTVHRSGHVQGRQECKAHQFGAQPPFVASSAPGEIVCSSRPRSDTVVSVWSCTIRCTCTVWPQVRCAGPLQAVGATRALLRAVRRATGTEERQPRRPMSGSRSCKWAIHSMHMHMGRYRGSNCTCVLLLRRKQHENGTHVALWLTRAGARAMCWNAANAVVVKAHAQRPSRCERFCALRPDREQSCRTMHHGNGPLHRSTRANLVRCITGTGQAICHDAAGGAPAAQQPPAVARRQSSPAARSTQSPASGPWPTRPRAQRTPHSC